jgi:hypothetical protein
VDVGIFHSYWLVTQAKYKSRVVETREVHNRET